MKRNDSPDFVGLEELKRKQREQLYNFECWVASGKWNEFHRHHYDWWMFPYNQPSSYGEAYTVYDYEVNLLKRIRFLYVVICAEWNYSCYRGDGN